MESAHDSFIWDLSWHPLGHILVSCSSDHTSKFWCRNRPGEEMRDRYNTASALITEDAVEGQRSHSINTVWNYSDCTTITALLHAVIPTAYMYVLLCVLVRLISPNPHRVLCH